MANEMLKLPGLAMRSKPIKKMELKKNILALTNLQKAWIMSEPSIRRIRYQYRAIVSAKSNLFSKLPYIPILPHTVAQTYHRA